MENAADIGQKITSDNTKAGSLGDVNTVLSDLKRRIDLATGQKKADLVVKIYTNT
jgi:hypothetical protein